MSDRRLALNTDEYSRDAEIPCMYTYRYVTGEQYEWYIQLSWISLIRSVEPTLKEYFLATWIKYMEDVSQIFYKTIFLITLAELYQERVLSHKWLWKRSLLRWSSRCRSPKREANAAVREAAGVSQWHSRYKRRETDRNRLKRPAIIFNEKNSHWPLQDISSLYIKHYRNELMNECYRCVDKRQCDTD